MIPQFSVFCWVTKPCFRKLEIRFCSLIFYRQILRPSLHRRIVLRLKNFLTSIMQLGVLRSFQAACHSLQSLQDSADISRGVRRKNWYLDAHTDAIHRFCLREFSSFFTAWSQSSSSGRPKIACYVSKTSKEHIKILTTGIDSSGHYMPSVDGFWTAETMLAIKKLTG